jgi:hypothetical protein
MTGHPFRKAYPESRIDDIEVDDDHQRRADALEQAVLAQRNPDAEGSQMSTKGRAKRDSNSCPPDS